MPRADAGSGCGTMSKRARRKSAQTGDHGSPGSAAPARPFAAATHSRWRPGRVDVLIAAALAVASFLLYARTFSYGFLEWDDPLYVTGNPVVQQGLTLDGVGWAFTTSHFANWLPVTWLSHMADVSLYGLNAGGHHATNAALHGLNAALLFVLLRSATGWRWRSLAAAALFAAHPLRVESVAWIAERKDVLAATFFLLTLLAYVRYARRPSAVGYVAVAVLFALGLMSKTMLVTLPCVLLLLDGWPLRRWRPEAVRTSADDAAETAQPAEPSPGVNPDAPPPAAVRPLGWLIREKVPLLALAVVASAWTFVFQTTGGAARDDLTMPQRLANAAVSVPRYLGKMAWPAGLSPFYPHPGDWPAWAVAGSVLLVLALTFGAWYVRRSAPYVIVGWLWFLGMLVPVSGVIQAGNQAMADRYTYLPGIGLTVAAVWAVAEWMRHRPAVSALRRVVPAATAVLVVALAVASVVRQGDWRNTRALFERALAVDERNWLAHTMVGVALASDGQPAAAVGHYQRSLELNPSYTNTYLQLADVHFRSREYDKAIAALREAVRRDPALAPAHVLLGNALSEKRAYAEADAAYGEALRLTPDDDAGLFVAWGVSYVNRGQLGQAEIMFSRALAIEPGNPNARTFLRAVQARQQQQQAPNPGTPRGG